MNGKPRQQAATIATNATFAAWFCCALPPVAWGTAPVAGGPILTLKLDVGGEVVGPLLDYDDQVIVIEYRGWPAALAFAELQTPSAYQAKKTILAIERGGESWLTAADHIDLARFALQRDHMALANIEFRAALELDPALQEQVRDERAQYRQRRRDNRRAAVASPLQGNKNQKVTVNGPTPAANAANTDAVIQKPAGQSPLNTFDISSPIGAPNATRAEWTEAYRRHGATIGPIIGADLLLVETDHFLIWTDWPGRDRHRLAEWCETMYAALAAQFNQPDSDNVFLGKCPIYCFYAKAKFMRFARDVDHVDPADMAGYAICAPNGHVHVAVHLRSRSPYELERFAGTLVHEGVHAFLHRLGRTGNVRGWVGEGAADYFAERVLGDDCIYGERAKLVARQIVLRAQPIDDLLTGRNGQLRSHDYPIAHSLVSYLIERDAPAFDALLAEIKNGAGTTTALSRAYRLTTAELNVAWRAWVAATTD